MKKHHEKIILRSEMFKARKTPEKTPERERKSVSKSPMPKSPRVTPLKQQQKVDPNELFQKVCCPNCKYVFKIIKGGDILSQQTSKRKSADTPVHKTTQTDDFILKETLQLKILNEQLNKQLSNRNQSSLFRTDSFRNNSVPINQALQSSRIRENTYKFEDLPHSKSSVSKKLSFQRKSQSSSIILPKNKDKNGKISRQRQIETRLIVADDQVENRQQKKKSQIRTMLVHQIQSDVLLDDLCQFYRQLPQSVQIPAYHKMLVQQFAVSPINHLSY